MPSNSANRQTLPPSAWRQDWDYQGLRLAAQKSIDFPPPITPRFQTTVHCPRPPGLLKNSVCQPPHHHRTFDSFQTPPFSWSSPLPKYAHTLLSWSPFNALCFHHCTSQIQYPVTSLAGSHACTLYLCITDLCLNCTGIYINKFILSLYFKGVLNVSCTNSITHWSG